MIELLVRIVIDTNIWVSALISPRGEPARLMRAVRDRRIQLVMSPPLLAEVRAVLRRPRIRRRIDLDDGDIDVFIREAIDQALHVTTRGDFRLSRDPKDDMVVETAIEGGAQYIVSRDEDLTRDLDLLNAIQGYGIEVLTVARFLERLDAEPA